MNMGHGERTGNETTVFDIVMADTCHYTLCHNPEDVTQHVNLNVNRGLWLIILYQYWLINYNKCTVVPPTHTHS